MSEWEVAAILKAIKTGSGVEDVFGWAKESALETAFEPSRADLDALHELDPINEADSNVDAPDPAGLAACVFCGEFIVESDVNECDDGRECLSIDAMR